MKTIIITLLSICILMSFKTYAQVNIDTDENKHEKFSKVELSRLAMKLSYYGYENKSATALISAAEIIIKNKIIDLKPGKNKTNLIEKETKNYDYVKSMLNQARIFAKDDKELIALANKIEGGLFALKSSRGVVGGAKVGNHQLSPKGTNSFWLVFKADELAEISVIGTGKNVIELHVYDEKGKLTKKDIRFKAECYVSWQPQIRSAYKIEIKNSGNTQINYSITTN